VILIIEEAMHVFGMGEYRKSLYLPFNFTVNLKLLLKNKVFGVPQLVKGPTLDFGPGHDLRVVRSEPHIRLPAQRGACFSLSSPFMLSLTVSVNLSVSLSQVNK